MRRDDATGNPVEGRRRFLRLMAAVGVGGQALLHSRDMKAAVLAAKDSVGEAPPTPPMTYRKLGRTNHEASRLVFGCGAALSRQPNEPLLDAAFDAGINVFDVGFREYYKDAEKNLAPFLKRKRDDIFLISKAFIPLEIEPHDEITVAQAKQGAAGWRQFMDRSLGELQVDAVDAYYLMASNNVSVVGNEEIHRVFEDAKQAGKVKHLGLSTHQNAHKVLETAIESGRFDLAMLAITPAGWYDWIDKGLLPDSPPMKDLRPLLDRARASGMGLIGMKAGRYLAGRKFLGWGKKDAFDAHYGPELLQARLSAFQRSYAFVLEHGLDCVNADMQNLAHLHENLVAATTSKTYFA